MTRRILTRREFLARSLITSAGAGMAIGSPGVLFGQDCRPADMPRTLVNLMLQGGADLRFLFMPSPGHFSSRYVQQIWAARKALYPEPYPDYTQMFDNEYLVVTDPLSGFTFGFHKSAGWLKAQFDNGNVALVANSFCSLNRRHDQSILNADAGEPDLDVLNFDRDGWGGRLVEYLGGPSNSVELGDSVSTFNKGSAPGNRLERVVHAQDMRNFSLAGTDAGNPASRRNILARALNAYYKARSAEVPAEKPANWPYHKFYQHHDALLAFGGPVESRLAACSPLPESLVNLQLSSPEFAQQCRNLFDACQVPEQLGVGTLSMNYGGWDTHDNQSSEITESLADVFGQEGGLATALDAIQSLPYLEQAPDNQLVFTFASDFGRQLVANGAIGTDHGRGTYSILIGPAVRGGIYGDMFPDRETQPDPDGQVPLKTPGADIEGLTSTQRILAAAADWIKPGAGEVVFPGVSSSALENGVDLTGLF